MSEFYTYVQTVIGPEACKACGRTVNELWELVDRATDQPIKRRCTPCAIQEGWAT